MSSRSFFISDLHLDASRPAVTRALAGFLDARRDAAALYILGDLFEAWIGDDDDSPLVAEVSDLLASYSADGPALYLMHGNRDFLMGDAFAKRIGATLLPDPSTISLGSQHVLLMHGDSLCTLDTDYQAFRALARDPNWQAGMLAKPLAERRALAAQLRAVSRDAGSRKADDIMDVTDAEVIRAMQRAECPVLIHGHTHRPARHENTAGTRWVLGDWEHTGWYIQASADNIDLIEFDIDQ